eukprot:4810484-Amphidinium_carterae.1
MLAAKQFHTSISTRIQNMQSYDFQGRSGTTTLMQHRCNTVVKDRIQAQTNQCTLEETQLHLQTGRRSCIS